MKDIVGEATAKDPNGVTPTDIDGTIYNSFKDRAPTGKDFQDVATVMGGADNVGTLHTIYEETGVRPDQVFEDARNNPQVAADIADGKVPEAYEHLVEPKPILPPQQAEQLQVSRSDTGKSFNVVDKDGDHVQGGFDSYEEAKQYIEDKKLGDIGDEPPEWSKGQEIPSLEISSGLSERPYIMTRPQVSPETHLPSRQISEHTPSPGEYTTRATSPSTSEGPVKTSNLSDIPKVYHKLTELSLIKDVAESSKANLDNLLETISKNTKGVLSEGSRIKEEGRLSEKLLTKNPQNIGDFLAGRTVIDTLSAAKDVVAQLRKFADVVEVDDFMNDTGRDSGYRATHVQIMGENGLSAEVQIMPKEIREVYDEARGIYEKWRNRNPNENPAEYRADMARQKEIFDGAWKKFKERTREIFLNTEGSVLEDFHQKIISDTIKAAEKFVGKLTGTTFQKLGDAYIKTFQPELSGDKALRADAYLAKYKAAKQEAENAFYSQSEKAIRGWDKLTTDQRMQWLYDHETGRWTENDLDHARFQALLDASYKAEKESGASEAAYKENYLPHIWEDPKAIKEYFKSDAYIKKYGKDGFTKQSTFKLIQDGVRAGFKLKTDNPERMLISRLLAGHDMIATMNLLHDMQESGIAVRAKIFSAEKRIAKTQESLNAKLKVSSIKEITCW